MDNGIFKYLKCLDFFFNFWIVTYIKLNSSMFNVDNNKYFLLLF